MLVRTKRSQMKDGGRGWDLILNDLHIPVEGLFMRKVLATAKDVTDGPSADLRDTSAYGGDCLISH